MSNPPLYWYLIHYYQGPDYESYSGRIGLAPTKAEGQAIAAECKRRYWDEREAIETLNALIQAECVALDVRDPLPEKPKFQDAPRWKSGLRQEEITQEMRDERNRICSINEEMQTNFSAILEAWGERRTAASQAVLDANPELCKRAKVKTMEKWDDGWNCRYHPSKEDLDRREFYVTPIPVLTVDTLDSLDDEGVEDS